ncbi:MAG: hypothetical protein NVSMB21_15560 [Vulcanimicrobiaceae bacterium]
MLFPEQSVAANPNRCWNWFLREHQHRASGEPAGIITLVNDIVARHPIDRARIFVAGLSAGGAMAAILAEQAPDVFAAVGIMAGVALHASHDVSTAFAAMHGDVLKAHLHRVVTDPIGSASIYSRLRLSIWTGARDRLVVPQNASVLVDQFMQLIGLGPREGEVERRDGAEIVRFLDDAGRPRIEAWRVDAMGHAWSGGSFRGSHTWPKGPNASDEMMRFFLDDGIRPYRSPGAERARLS